MNPKTSWAALAVGLAVGGAVFLLLHQKAAEIEKRSTPVSILVAVRYIPSGVEVKNEWVERRSIPEAFVSPSALADLRSVEGLVTLAPFSAGEQVLSNKFGRPGETLGWALDQGFRAFTLAVQETSGVGGLLNPGDRVDVLYRGPVEGREATTFLFQNLRVLAAGARTAASAPGEGAGAGGYAHVTLAVTPSQAEQLFHLEGRADLRLVLRAKGDAASVRLPVVEGTAWVRSLALSAAPGAE